MVVARVPRQGRTTASSVASVSRQPTRSASSSSVRGAGAGRRGACDAAIRLRARIRFAGLLRPGRLAASAASCSCIRR